MVKFSGYLLQKIYQNGAKNGVDNIDEDGNIIHPYAIITIELTDKDDNVAVDDIYNPSTRSFDKPILKG